MYAHFFCSIFSLRALNHHVISDEEIVENLHLSGPFQPLSDSFKLQLYKSYPAVSDWPLGLYMINTDSFTSQGTSYKEELRGIYSMLLAVNTILAHYSPVMIVQRWARGWLMRRTLATSNNSRIKLVRNCIDMKL